MMKYFVYEILILFTSYCLIGCNKKQHELSSNQFKTALTVCLRDSDLKSRMELDKRTAKPWFLNGDFKVKGALNIDDRQYKFQNENLYVQSDSNILYKLSYPDRNLCHINLIYRPSVSFGIIGNFDFKYDDEKWKIIKRSAGIQDFASKL